MAEMTPMMRQYMEIKEQNKDSILFFRLGDFYEMFGDDARKASRELDLTLTTRDKDKNKSSRRRIPMCGIPYHASDAYIARLIAKGQYKVAICEQTEDPAAAKGLVERDIVRIVTPGTVIDSACLEEGRSNFCAGIYLDGDFAGFSVCDISTGQTHVTAFSGPDREAHLQNELGRFAPAEAVLQSGAAEDTALRRCWRTSSGAMWSACPPGDSSCPPPKSASASSSGTTPPSGCPVTIRRLCWRWVLCWTICTIPRKRT